MNDEQMNSEQAPEIEQPTESGYNKVEIPEGSYADTADGATVDFTGTGQIVTKPDGTRCIDVSTVDGKPVGAAEPEGEAEGEGEVTPVALPKTDNPKNDLIAGIKGLNAGKKHMYE